MSYLFDMLEWKVQDAIDGVKDAANTFALGVDDFVNASIETVEEITKNTIQFKQDLVDITFNDEAASDIVSEANGIISDNNEKYEKAYKKIQDKLLTLNHAREDVFYKKKLIALCLNQKCHNMIEIPETIPSFQENVPSYQKAEDILPQIFDLPLYKSQTGKIVAAVINVMESKNRVSNAKDYREQAKDYEIEVNAEIAKLRRMDCSVTKIQNILREESEILKVIMNSFGCGRKLENEKIAMRIRILLSEPILSENGKENVKYQKAVDELKAIVGTL
jgi:hypothetical protein